MKGKDSGIRRLGAFIAFLILYCLNTLIFGTQYYRNNLKEERFIWALSFREFSPWSTGPKTEAIWQTGVVCESFHCKVTKKKSEREEEPGKEIYPSKLRYTPSNMALPLNMRLLGNILNLNYNIPPLPLKRLMPISSCKMDLFSL